MLEGLVHISTKDCWNVKYAAHLMLLLPFGVPHAPHTNVGSMLRQIHCTLISAVGSLYGGGKPSVFLCTKHIKHTFSHFPAHYLSLCE